MMHPVKQLYQQRFRALFPSVECAFAYGSAVFSQHERPKGKMLDMIFVVRDPVHWHRENLGRNRRHYSWLRWCGPTCVQRVQEFSAGVYYNTLVQVDDQLIKYGVISVDRLIEDLLTWNSLYISGRLHKPVVVLTRPPCSAIDNALKENLRSAVLCALLLTDGLQCSEEDLYTTITRLSYQGDFRMYFGEDRDKVNNIVKPNMAEFRELYRPYLKDFVSVENEVIVKQVENAILLKEHWHCLPSTIRRQLEAGEMSLGTALSRIVWRSSIQQSAKGILTAGLSKTMRYASDKVTKMLRSSLLKKD